MAIDVTKYGRKYRKKVYPMGEDAQKEAAKKKLPERKVNLKALMDTLSDENTPMKKARLEESVRGKKMVLAKSGGRIGLKSGSKGCKLAMKGKGKAYGKNS
jgi:hypothetical protein